MVMDTTTGQWKAQPVSPSFPPVATATAAAPTSPGKAPSFIPSYTGYTSPGTYLFLFASFPSLLPSFPPRPFFPPLSSYQQQTPPHFSGGSPKATWPPAASTGDKENSNHNTPIATTTGYNQPAPDAAITSPSVSGTSPDARWLFSLHPRTHTSRIIPNTVQIFSDSRTHRPAPSRSHPAAVAAARAMFSKGASPRPSPSPSAGPAPTPTPGSLKKSFYSPYTSAPSTSSAASVATVDHTPQVRRTVARLDMRSLAV